MEDYLSPTLVAQIADYGVKILGALLLLVIGWIIAGSIGAAVRRATDRAGLDTTLQRFFGSMARYLVLAVVIMGCLSVFGVEMTSLAAVIAAAGFAVGMALQGTLSNFAAGVMLLIFRPFNVGDFVKTAGIAGTVTEIALFTTRFDTVDNRRIIVPNGAIFGSTIENVSHHPTRRMDIQVTVDYGADLDSTRAILEGIVSNAEERIEEPESVVYLTEMGDSAIVWTLRIWCNSEDYWALREKTMRAVKYALDEAQIGIPYPQMDVHIDGNLASGAAA